MTELAVVVVFAILVTAIDAPRVRVEPYTGG
jgi:hypothetical protein